MSCSFEWNQQIVPANCRFNLRQQERVITEIIKQIKPVKKKSVSVAFVSPDEIRHLNKNYRGKNKVTDVLAFPFNDSEMAGEVLICFSQAEKQAKQFGQTRRAEISILLVHGFLHLFGFDHLKKNEAKKMFLLQKTILKELGINWQPPAAG